MEFSALSASKGAPGARLCPPDPTEERRKEPRGGGIRLPEHRAVGRVRRAPVSRLAPVLAQGQEGFKHCPMLPALGPQMTWTQGQRAGRVWGAWKRAQGHWLPSRLPPADQYPLGAFTWSAHFSIGPPGRRRLHPAQGPGLSCRLPAWTPP